MRSHWFTVLVLSGLVALGGTTSRADDLSFEERVAAQRAIEGVYWSHRIWPAENPTPKPPLAEVLPDAAIRAKVADYLRKSNALEAWWQQPITGERLQAELERMARRTQDPQMLRELFVALGNDPRLIAETLVRQTLADRLIRNSYAFDERFHGELRAKAEAAFASAGGRASAVRDPEAERIELDAEAWAELQGDLAKQHGSAAAGSGPLVEEHDRFESIEILSKGEAALTATIATWRKKSFDEMWQERRAEFGTDLDQPSVNRTLPRIEGTGCVTENWTATFVGPPSARVGHTAVWTGTEMIVWGGSDLSSGGRYDPATDTWTTTSPAGAPTGRMYHTAVWTGTEMIVWGGNNSGGLDTGGRYDPSTDTWMATTVTGAPSARRLHTAVWTGTEMIVWGGDGNTGYVNTGGRYAPSTNSWTPTSTGANLPTARSSHTAVWTGTEMIVWGGFGGSYVNTGGRYDPSSDAWTATSTTNPPAARRWHTAVWSGTQMIVWGGYSGSALGTGGRYNPSTNAWATMAGGTSRYDHTAVWTGTEMIVWGGSGVGSSTLNSGGRYNPAGNSWTTTTTTGAPSARSVHSVVWTGMEMIVWGGWNGGVLLNTGGRYDPSANAWIAVAAAGAPSARFNHTAVWTGTEMIVWGGNGGIGGDPVNDGAGYNAAIDAWTPTALTSAPSARYQHTAVWTGTEMIVWGGFNVVGSLSSGGRYNPSANLWTATGTIGVPAARGRHTVVWTGTKMIIWGGGSGVQTGGRYDPSADSWAATAITGAPSGRYEHTAVWTGAEMIVWGGTGSTGPTDTGGRYDPTIDDWTPTTLTSAPTARDLHTAVWTGTEMIVWGGSGSFDLSGGRYDPSADSWAAIATTGEPIRRYGHTAVWTGTEMIVWGGSGYPFDDSGGRYNPTIDDWMATTPIGAPSPRTLHTAVWTGTEMIVWGGFGLNSGGRYVLGACTCPIPETGLVSWWPADGNASDVVGGYDGTTQNGLSYAAGQVGQAFDFDGSDDVVGPIGEPSTYAFIQNTGVFTIAAWIRLDDATALLPLAITGNTQTTAEQGHFFIWNNSDGLQRLWIGIVNGTPGVPVINSLSASGVINDTGWHHVAAVGDGTNVTFYVDGVGSPGSGTMGTLSTGDSTRSLSLGAANCCPFDGALDEVMIYDRALAGAEIKGIYLGGRSAPVGSPEFSIYGGPWLTWTAVSGATGYDVVRGNLTTLHATGGDFTAAVDGCIADDVTATYLVDPAVGGAVFFLVRPVTCGWAGTYDSGGPSQVGSRDAEIQASSAACP